MGAVVNFLNRIGAAVMTNSVPTDGVALPETPAGAVEDASLVQNFPAFASMQARVRPDLSASRKAEAQHAIDHVQSEPTISESDSEQD